MGNLLWTQGSISGVVDWVETSWGPVDLDVAHAASYLAMLQGGDAATRFVDAYRRRTDGCRDEEGFRYWNVLDIVGYLPDPVKVARPWREAGVEVSDAVARKRLEQRLAGVLRGRRD